jgi:hypothetical protein
LLPHKDFILPAVDLSHDDGDPRWHEAGGEDATAVIRDGVIVHYRWNGLQPGHHGEYWRLCVVEHWNDLVRRYESDPFDVHACYWYIDNHPVFWSFGKKWTQELPADHISFLEHEGAMSRGWPDITPHVDEQGLFWAYEFGPRLLRPDMNGYQGAVHDWRLDGTSHTYELAAVAIAEKIWYSYGNDRRVVDSPGWITKESPPL